MPTVHVSSNIELNAVLNGVAQLETPELESFARRVNALLAQRRAPHLPQREAELLQRIGQSSPALQPRYQELNAKRRAATLTPAEHQELLALIEQKEEANAERLRALLELAALRGITLDELMEQLGLDAPPPPVYG